ncbi:MAG: efflux RND transporter periplasmic adaptor subunit [Acidobacteriota bacterium]
MSGSITVSAVAMLVALTSACGGREPVRREHAPSVTTAPAQVRRVELALPLVGHVEASREIRLVALVQGTVARIAVADGAAVGPGDVVFKLGGPLVEARRQSLESAAESRRRELAASRDRLTRARRRLESQLAGPFEVTEAETATASAEAALAEARATLRRFRSALEIASPTAGRFVDRRVSAGQQVVPGQTLGEVLAADAIRADVTVLGTADRQPRAGDAAEIVRDSGPPISVEVLAVKPRRDSPGSVKAWLAGPALAVLQPGVAVRGRVIVAVHENAVVVPASAVVRDGEDRPLVYTGDRAPFIRRDVTTGETGPGWIEITRGLAAGEPVVVRGAYELYWAGFAREFKAAD